jgi:hypothetical protein
MILGVVTLGLLLAYAYPVRVFLAQQAEIAALEQRQERQRARITELEERYAKWNDEQYAISQARKRLHMVLPGETPYFVIDPEGSEAVKASAQNPEPKREIPWYGKLWSSIESADQR